MKVLDLSVKSLHELIRLAKHLEVDIGGCLDKEELVTSIAISGRVEIVGPSVGESRTGLHRDTSFATRMANQSRASRRIRRKKHEHSIGKAEKQKQTTRKVSKPSHTADQAAHNQAICEGSVRKRRLAATASDKVVPPTELPSAAEVAGPASWLGGAKPASDRAGKPAGDHISLLDFALWDVPLMKLPGIVEAVASATSTANASVRKRRRVDTGLNKPVPRMEPGIFDAAISTPSIAEAEQAASTHMAEAAASSSVTAAAEPAAGGTLIALRHVDSENQPSAQMPPATTADNHDSTENVRLLKNEVGPAARCSTVELRHDLGQLPNKVLKERFINRKVVNKFAQAFRTRL